MDRDRAEGETVTFAEFRIPSKAKDREMFRSDQATDWWVPLSLWGYLWRRVQFWAYCETDPGIVMSKHRPKDFESGTDTNDE